MAAMKTGAAALAFLALIGLAAAADQVITVNPALGGNNFPVGFHDFGDVPKPAECAAGGSTKYLAATKDTVHWGYTYAGAKPAAAVQSGSTITVEMLTHQAGDAADLMLEGDKNMEEIYKWDASGMAIPFRGYTGRGDGKHIMTGPIHICGAEPGDTVKIEILDLYPRPNPKTGKTYGSQAATRWGYQFRTGLATGLAREMVTIYELVKAKSGRGLMYAAPRFKFTATQDGPNDATDDVKAVTACQPASYSVPRTHPGYNFTIQNPDLQYPAVGIIPCVNGTQTWPRIVMGGMVRPTTAPRDTSVDGKYKVPINLHIGNIGLAQPITIPYTSTTPTNTGNNLDNRRLGKGATLYVPVKVYGGLLQMGDCHTAQGDSEYDGTAIETSLTGDFKITLIKKADAPEHLKELKTPLIENENEWVVQGHTYDDYMRELYNDTASPPVLNPMSVIASKSDLDMTMMRASVNTRDFLLNKVLGKNLNEDDAISLMTTGLDFAVTQVVDQNWGIHTVIPKYVFEGETDGSKKELYVPKTFPGSSVKGKCTFKPKDYYSYPKKNWVAGGPEAKSRAGSSRRRPPPHLLSGGRSRAGAPASARVGTAARHCPCDFERTIANHGHSFALSYLFAHHARRAGARRGADAAPARKRGRNGGACAQHAPPAPQPRAPPAAQGLAPAAAMSGEGQPHEGIVVTWSATSNDSAAAGAAHAPAVAGAPSASIAPSKAALVQGGGKEAVYEWLFVGAGISGIYNLGNLPLESRAGALLIEQHDSIGGLWAKLPAWQTVQNDPLDFCTEGLTTRKKVWAAADVVHMLQQKARLMGLGPHIRLGHKLAGYEWREEGGGYWACQVERLSDGAALTLRTRRLALCTGKHAVPKIPEIPTDGSVKILHSSQIEDFSIVEGRRVAVVGAGASGLDLCVNSITHGAEGQVEWVVRTPKLFMGFPLAQLWPVALFQLIYGIGYGNWAIRCAAEKAFAGGWHGRVPVLHGPHQACLWVIPGRAFLLRNKKRLTRHVGASVSKVEAGSVHLSDGAVLESVDMLLLGTGYGTPERPAGFAPPKQFAGFLPTGAARGKLYLVGEPLLDTTGASPLVAHQLSLPFWAIDGGRAPTSDSANDGKVSAGCCGVAPGVALSEERSTPEDPRQLLNLLETVEMAAPLAREHFPFYVWRLKFIAIYLFYRLWHKTTVFYPDRIIELGLNLDEMPRESEAVTIVTK
ncbi:MAG: hypothetical protein J3K34DRAFT_390713 [Monoraphidium minutum]|nr:MAG: hypothetical protein J3K34DRAFT_390713 [Monoraphidium minutum]